MVLLIGDFHMRVRHVTKIRTNNTIEQFLMAEEDMERYTNHLRDMDDPSLVIVENNVIHVGKFDSTTINNWLKKVKKETK